MSGFCPSTLLPVGMEELGSVKVCNTMEEALEGCDVVMGLRIQLERQKRRCFLAYEYSRFFGLNNENVKDLGSDVLFMHPGPVNRGLEMTSNIIDSDQSVINLQVTNGVAVRMALLYLLTGREDI